MLLSHTDHCGGLSLVSTCLAPSSGPAFGQAARAAAGDDRRRTPPRFRRAGELQILAKAPHSPPSKRMRPSRVPLAVRHGCTSGTPLTRIHRDHASRAGCLLGTKATYASRQRSLGEEGSGVSDGTELEAERRHMVNGHDSKKGCGRRPPVAVTRTAATVAMEAPWRAHPLDCSSEYRSS